MVHYNLALILAVWAFISFCSESILFTKGLWTWQSNYKKRKKKKTHNEADATFNLNTVLKIYTLKVESVALFAAACKHKLGPSSLLNATSGIVACTYNFCTYTASYVGILHLFNGEIDNSAS